MSSWQVHVQRHETREQDRTAGDSLVSDSASTDWLGRMRELPTFQQVSTELLLSMWKCNALGHGSHPESLFLSLRKSADEVASILDIDERNQREFALHVFI